MKKIIGFFKYIRVTREYGTELMRRAHEYRLNSQNKDLNVEKFQSTMLYQYEFFDKLEGLYDQGYISRKRCDYAQKVIREHLDKLLVA